MKKARLSSKAVLPGKVWFFWQKFDLHSPSRPFLRWAHQWDNVDGLALGHSRVVLGLSLPFAPPTLFRYAPQPLVGPFHRVVGSPDHLDLGQGQHVAKLFKTLHIGLFHKQILESTKKENKLELNIRLIS